MRLTGGSGYEGALGHGGKKDQKQPTLVAALGKKRIVSVSCGRDSTLAVTCCGKLFTCGADDYGHSWALNATGPRGVRGYYKEIYGAGTDPSISHLILARP